MASKNDNVGEVIVTSYPFMPPHLVKKVTPLEECAHFLDIKGDIRSRKKMMKKPDYSAMKSASRWLPLLKAVVKDITFLLVMSACYLRRFYYLEKYVRTNPTLVLTAMK